MRFPRLPDWLVYSAVVGALLFGAISRQEDADAPLPPPPPINDGEVLGPASPFDPNVIVEVPNEVGPSSGTAFSVAESGVWMTARHVVDGCGRTAVVVGPGRGVAATVQIDPRSEAAILTTSGGTPPLGLNLGRALYKGQRAFHPGYPQGRPGEATSRLLGRETLVVRGRGARTEPVLVWAETGRTEGLEGTLGGLSGAPALDSAGRVVGVTVAESPRRGRIYTTAPEVVSATLEGAGRRFVTPATGQPISAENYWRVADTLRRDLQVAQVVCLT